MADKERDSDRESGARWWFKNVIVPLIGSGGVATLLIAFFGPNRDKPREPTPLHTLSASPAQNTPISAKPEDTASQKGSASSPPHLQIPQELSKAGSPANGRSSPDKYQFTVFYEARHNRPVEADSPFVVIDLTLYLDGVAAARLVRDGQKYKEVASVATPTLGPHTYSLTGTITTRSISGDAIAANVGGEGEFDVQEGASYEVYWDPQKSPALHKPTYSLRQR